MCQKPDSLISFYLIYFYIYGVLFTYFFDLLFSKTRQHLRCNLLFGLIGHFGLLKDLNISFSLILTTFSLITKLTHTRSSALSINQQKLLVNMSNKSSTIQTQPHPSMPSQLSSLIYSTLTRSVGKDVSKGTFRGNHKHHLCEARMLTPPYLFRIQILRNRLHHASRWEGINILGTPIHILIYADNIILISECHISLQLHPRWFSIKRLTVHLPKT